VNGNHGLYGDLARQQEREQEIAPLVTVMVLIWKQKIAFQVSYRFFFNIYFDFFMFTFFFLILGIPWIRKGSGSYERYNRVIHHISFNPIQDGPFGGSPGMGRGSILISGKMLIFALNLAHTLHRVRNTS